MSENWTIKHDPANEKGVRLWRLIDPAGKVRFTGDTAMLAEGFAECMADWDRLSSDVESFAGKLESLREEVRSVLELMDGLSVEFRALEVPLEVCRDRLRKAVG